MRGSELKKMRMKINAVEFMYIELCYKSSTSKYENKTVILIFPRYPTYLLICCVFSLEKWWHCSKCTNN